MRLLLSHPGPLLSVSDVWKGLRRALARAGAEVIDYHLDGRLQYTSEFLAFVHGKQPDRPQPSDADVFWQASAMLPMFAEHHQVDWVVVVSGLWTHPDALRLLRRAGFRIAIVFTESPALDEDQLCMAECATVCWTNERTSVARFRAAGIDCQYWQHAIDPERHSPGPAIPGTPAHDVVFVGSGWEERIHLLSAVDWTGIDLGLYGAWEHANGTRLEPYVHEGIIPNEQAVSLYRAAKIGLNLHRTAREWGVRVAHVAGGESMNPRGYELGACGLFHVSDRRAEVSEVYGGLVPTFETAAELEALIRRYLADDEERQRIAAQLPACVARHTFDARAAEMLTVLEGYHGVA